MPNADAMSPDFDNFLSALIGVEANGMPISVMSALARLNLDPWREAARLSALTKEAATAALYQLIGRLPGVERTPSDMHEITARLVGLLPPQRSAVANRVEQKGGKRMAFLPKTKDEYITYGLYLTILVLSATLFYFMK